MDRYTGSYNETRRRNDPERRSPQDILEEASSRIQNILSGEEKLKKERISDRALTAIVIFIFLVIVIASCIAYYKIHLHKEHIKKRTHLKENLKAYMYISPGC